MPQNRYGLIQTPPAQSLINEYESDLLYYLRTWEDNILYDDFFDAWKDDRIGGTRATVNAHNATMKSLAPDNFIIFKEKVSAELQQQIKQTTSELKRQQLQQDYDKLQRAEDFADFGKGIGNLEQHQITANFDDYRRADLLTNNDENRPQVNWTIDAISSCPAQQYNMMQSIAYAATNGIQIPIIEPQAKKIRDEIANGIQYYNKHEDDGVYWSDDGRKSWKDNLSFQHIREPAFRAKGIAQAYTDALKALMASPNYDIIRQYYIEKAHKTNDSALLELWKTGHNQKIDFYLSKNKLVPGINCVGLAGMSTDPIITDKVIPTLQELNMAEARYNVLSQMVNNFNNYIKTHPHELERLKNQKDTSDKVVSFNMDISNKELNAHKTVMALSDLLLSEDVLIERIYEGAKWTAIGVGSFCVPGGLLVSCAVGTAAGATAMGLDFLDKYGEVFPDENSTLRGPNFQKRFQGLFKDKQGLILDLKNSHVLEQIKKIIEKQDYPTKQAIRRIYQIPLSDFDNSINYALNHASVKNKEILEFVCSAREIAKLPQEEFMALEKEYLQDVANLEKRKAAGDATVNEDEVSLARQGIMLECAKSGMYFAVARRGLEYLENYKREKEQHFSKFRHYESSLLNEVSRVLTARIDAEYEADIRSQIVNTWKNAGCPKERPQYDTKSSSFENGTDINIDFSDDPLTENNDVNKNGLSNSLSNNGALINVDDDPSTERSYQINKQQTL